MRNLPLIFFLLASFVAGAAGTVVDRPGPLWLAGAFCLAACFTAAWTHWLERERDHRLAVLFERLAKLERQIEILFGQHRL